MNLRNHHSTISPGLYIVSYSLAVSLIWCNHVTLIECSSEHGLLRAKDPYSFLTNPTTAVQASNSSANPLEVEQSTANPVNLSTEVVATKETSGKESKLEFQETTNLNQTSSSSSVGVLSLDYGDLDSDTNKTKRSKAPVRWLKHALGLESSAAGNQAISELMEGQSDLPRESEAGSTDTPSGDGSILSKLNPFNIKRKLSSKVSTVSNTAGQVYQTIAGKVGLGSSSGSGNTETGASDADMDDNGRSSGMSDKEDDEESSAHQSRASLPLALWIATFSLIVSVSL